MPLDEVKNENYNYRKIESNPTLEERGVMLKGLEGLNLYSYGRD